MSTSLLSDLILMLDDQTEHESKARALQEASGYSVKFVTLQDRDVFDAVHALTREMPQPAMILIDHVLDKAVGQSPIHKGSSVAPIIREAWPAPPIIAVTAAYDVCLADIDSDVYEDVVRIERFSDFVKHVPAIIDGYLTLRTARPGLDDLVALLAPPDPDKDTILASIPTTVKNAINGPALGHRFFRWFRRQFYSTPGFLFDVRWTAVTIGIAEQFIDRYLPRIESARFTGVFADVTNPRWWKAGLYSAILPQSQERFTADIRATAKQQLNVSSQHVATCYRCGEDYPDVMGALDDTTKSAGTLEPLHFRCSREDLTAAPQPYYESPRIMLEDD